MSDKPKPNRMRKAMTLTLSKHGVEYMNSYARKHDQNRSEAIDALIKRYETLLTFAEPAVLKMEQFRTLAQLADGPPMTSGMSPKTNLLDHVTGRLGELKAFERDMAQRTFADDTPEARQEVTRKMEGERSLLGDLHVVVENLSELQSMVIIEAIEDLYSREGDIEALCTEIFAKLWPANYHDLSF